MQRKPSRPSRLRVAAITAILLAAVLLSIALQPMPSADQPFPAPPSPEIGDTDYALALAIVQCGPPGPQILSA